MTALKKTDEATTHMNKILMNIMAAAAVTISAQGAGITADQGLMEYCYPGNAVERPDLPVYLPGEQTMAVIAADGKRIVALNIADGKEAETLLDLGNTRETTLDAIEGFTVSPDGRKILVWNGKKMIYRRSFRANYYVYDRHSRILRPLSTESATQRSPLFSPDGRMVAFTADDISIRFSKLD